MIGVGQIGRPGIVSARRGSPLALDALSAIVAYSTRRLRTAYVGPCMRVRRSSDNAETDIGFGSDGWIDQAALLTHAASGSSFVVTWYDQSENTRNATQAVAGNQPRIVNSGVVEVMGGRAAPLFLGQATATFLDTGDVLNQNFTAVCVARAPALVASSFPTLYSRGTTGAQGATFMSPSVPNLSVRFGAAANEAVWTGFTAGTNHVVSAFHSAALRWVRGDSNAPITDTTVLTPDDALRRLRIGSNAGAAAAATFPGWIGEIAVFQSDLGQSESVLHANLMARWL